MVRGSLLLLPSTLLVLVATACGQSDTGPPPPTPTATPRFELGVTHTFNSWGYSMAYPAGWLTGLNQRTTFVSELFEDHDNRNWPLLGPPRPTKGYQVTLSLPYSAEYYLGIIYKLTSAEASMIDTDISVAYGVRHLGWERCVNDEMDEGQCGAPDAYPCGGGYPFCNQCMDSAV